MSKKRRGFFTMLLALSMLCALSVPAFAADFSGGMTGLSQLLRSGQGYETQTIYLGGKAYNCEFSLGSGSNGAYSEFDTVARVTRRHNNVTVKFDTVHDGYDTQSGGATTANSFTGRSYSGYVRCKYGMEAVTGYLYIGGSGSVSADETYNFTVSAS